MEQTLNGNNWKLRKQILQYQQKNSGNKKEKESDTSHQHNDSKSLGQDMDIETIMEIFNLFAQKTKSHAGEDASNN